MEISATMEWPFSASVHKRYNPSAELCHALVLGRLIQFLQQGDFPIREEIKKNVGLYDCNLVPSRSISFIRCVVCTVLQCECSLDIFIIYSVAADYVYIHFKQ